MTSRRKTVLLAEDNPDDRFLMRECLRKVRLEAAVRMVEDGQEAIDYLCGAGAFTDRAAHPSPSLLILDVKMPRKSGFEVLEWVRASECWRMLPVLMLTTSADPIDVQRAYELAANGYLVKPPTVQELLELLEGVRTLWLKFGEFPPLPRPAVGPKPGASAAATS